MLLQTRPKVILTISVLWMLLLALSAVAASVSAQIPEPDGNSLGLAKPLKVYILAGQSNMEGQASIEIFDYIGDDPATAPLLKEMRDTDGKPRVCENVWIPNLTEFYSKQSECSGKLTAGYGGRQGPKI